MPKITIDNARGLVTQSGSGVDIKSAGVVGCVSSSEALTDTGPKDYNGSLSLPAGATIIEAGFVAKTVIKTANVGVSDVLETRMGTNTDGSGQEIMPVKDILGQNKEAVAGSSQNTSAGNKAEAASTVIAFADGAPLYSSTARTIYYRVKVGNTALVKKGTAAVYVKYLIS